MPSKFRFNPFTNNFDNILTYWNRKNAVLTPVTAGDSVSAILLSTDTINEFTAANGVTIDGINFRQTETDTLVTYPPQPTEVTNDGFGYVFKDSTFIGIDSVTGPELGFADTALHINGDNFQSTQVTTTRYSNDNFSPGLIGQKARGTFDVTEDVQIFDNLIWNGAYGWAGNRFRYGGEYAIYAAENWSEGVQGTGFQLFLTQFGTSTIFSPFFVDGDGIFINDYDTNGIYIGDYNTNNTFRIGRASPSSPLRFQRYNGSSYDVVVLMNTDNSIQLNSGTNVNEFSIDGTLAGNSDDAVPTEQAVKTYVDEKTAIYIGTFDSNTTLDDTYNIVVGETNAFTFTLPPAATYYSSERTIQYTIKNDKANTNNITLAADGSETIDGSNTFTIPPGAAPKVVSDGTKWHII